MKLQELLDSIGLKCGAGLVSRPKTFDTKAKEWQDTAFHWRVTLKLEGRQYETDYWCGWAHAKGMPPVIRTQYHEQLALKAKPIPPKSADVVCSLVLDNYAMDEIFEDWCANLDYDTDSRKALDTYLRCQNHGKAMRYLLGKHFAAVQEAAQDY